MKDTAKMNTQDATCMLNRGKVCGKLFETLAGLNAVDVENQQWSTRNRNMHR